MQAFGVSEEELSKYIGNGIIPWDEMIDEVLSDIELRINQTRNSDTTSLVTVLLEGLIINSVCRQAINNEVRVAYPKCIHEYAIFKQGNEQC